MMIRCNIVRNYAFNVTGQDWIKTMIHKFFGRMHFLVLILEFSIFFL